MRHGKVLGGLGEYLGSVGEIVDQGLGQAGLAVEDPILQRQTVGDSTGP